MTPKFNQRNDDENKDFLELLSSVRRLGMGLSTDRIRGGRTSRRDPLLDPRQDHWAIKPRDAEGPLLGRSCAGPRVVPAWLPPTTGNVW
jgi:hypothetical protein